MKTNHNILSPEILGHLMRDRKARQAVACQNHLLFFHLYLSRYVKYDTADFQRELFKLTEDSSTKHAAIVAFRGSAKTTIMTLSYPLWAILGVQQKKFILMLSQTQSQAQQMLVNLKREIENNDILRNDFGELEKHTDEWGRESLVIKRYGARIMAASTETSIRGVRFGEHRPDLIICDDVEDLQSVKTREGRNKTYDWLMGDVIPAGDTNTRVIVIGNLLHEDSLLMRLKGDMQDQRLGGVYLQYPLLDDDKNPLWPGKFPTKESIEALHKTVPSMPAWQREYMLNIVPDQDQLVFREWIKYYDELPPDNTYKSVMAVDLAIGLNKNNDFTAILSARIYGYEQNMHIFILPNIINKRMTFPEQRLAIKAIADSLGHPTIYIEDVAYQRSLIQQLVQDGYKAKGAKVYGQDKFSRLETVTHLLQNGQIHFPRKRANQLIEQLIGFGVEKHDDLADAFSILLQTAIESNKRRCRVWAKKPRGF